MTKIYQSPRVRFIAISAEDTLLVTSLLYARSGKGGHEGYGETITISDDEAATNDFFQVQCWD